MLACLCLCHTTYSIGLSPLQKHIVEKEVVRPKY